MAEEQPLRAAQAARRLGIPTKELLRLVYERKIRYVMVDGIAHVPIDAVEEYRSKALWFCIAGNRGRCRRGDLNPYALAGTSPSS